jgi:hypothetical protein
MQVPVALRSQHLPVVVANVTLDRRRMSQRASAAGRQYRLAGKSLKKKVFTGWAADFKPPTYCFYMWKVLLKK